MKKLLVLHHHRSFEAADGGGEGMAYKICGEQSHPWVFLC